VPVAGDPVAGKGDARHKVIITGTGRAGTTLLVQLLTELGLDTGFASSDQSVDPKARAGMEWGLANPEAPYVVKNPGLCLTLEKHLQSGRVVVDHAFVPIRDLKQAAASRIAVSAAAGEPDSNGCRLPGGVPGGLWRTSRPERQADVLAQLLCRLIRVLTVYDIPHTFLDFPRFSRDADYLYRKLTPLLSGIGVQRFRQVYRRVARPQLVHRFEDALVDGKRR
jgi:hypothetical protein